MIRGPKPICYRHPLDFTVTITLILSHILYVLGHIADKDKQYIWIAPDLAPFHDIVLEARNIKDTILIIPG